MAASKPKKRIATVPRAGEVVKLRKQIADLKLKYTKVAMEKKFLERAMGDLNFHNNAHDGVVYTDANNQIIYANPYFLGMMGIQNKKELLDHPFPSYMWNNEQEAGRLFKDIKNDGFVREREMALYNREGQPVFAMCSGVANKDEDGEIIGTEIMFCNITSKRAFQAELLEQQALMDAILQSTPDPILVLNADLELQRSNSTADQLFQVQKEKKRIVLELLENRALGPELIGKIETSFHGDRDFDFELSLGDQYFEFHAAPMKSIQKGWVCILHNITVRKLTQEMLQHHAFHDALTQLPNRSHFVDHLRSANVLTKSEPDYRYAILFIDVDDLKSFNDRLGHHVGDELLFNFARRLEANIRPGDLVARLGGDEFAIFLDRILERETALQVATRVRENLLKPYRLNDTDGVQASASIGIALSDGTTPDAETLLRNADKAMYHVKQQGGNGFEVFTEEILAQQA